MTTNEHSVIPVKDDEVAQQSLRLMSSVVEEPFHLKHDWIRRVRWAVVPVESGGHFSEREAEWFSEAASSIGCSECLAVATEPLENADLCYLVRTSQEGFLAINRACAGLNYVLIPKDRSFAILLTTEDYYIVAGPKDFVVKAIGTSINTARKMFFRFSNDSHWPEDIRARLLNVAKRYEGYNGQ